MSLDGNSTNGTLLAIESPTCFILRDLYVHNSNHTGIDLVSWRDSHIENVFVESCGDSTHPAAILDSVAVSGEGFNANKFYNFHVESNTDAIQLDLIGNSTAIVDSNAFYNIKLHGDPSTTNNPNRPLLRIGANASLNSFYGGIFGFGRGTSQVEISGSNNCFYSQTLGIGSIAQPETAFDIVGGRNEIHSPEFSSTTYSVAMIRTSTGGFNVVTYPKYGGGTLFSDVSGSVSIIYSKPDNTGDYFYSTRGFAFSTATRFDASLSATLQTTTSGLAAGTFWNDGGTVKVV